MRIEQKGSDNGKGNSNTTNKGSSRRSKRKQKKMSPIQRLYETCNEVFDNCGPGIVPSPEKVEKLAAVLDKMTQEDVGLKPDMPFFDSRRAPIITYLHLHECDKFSMGIFCLPPSSVIPLHNHPGMTVFSKLLFGTMHIKSFDWAPNKATTSSSIDPPKSDPKELQLARVKLNSEFTAPCRASILYPADGGNMHCFTAKTACAVLDVLGPPYCDPEGRHCQYYFDFPFSRASVNGITLTEEEKEGYAWLQERDKPEDLAVVGMSYNGPEISKK